MLKSTTIRPSLPAVRAPLAEAGPNHGPRSFQPSDHPRRRQQQLPKKQKHEEHRNRARPRLPLGTVKGQYQNRRHQHIMRARRQVTNEQFPQAPARYSTERQHQGTKKQIL